MSETTKELFVKRARQFQNKKPTVVERKRWNKKIRNECRNHYRRWVANCTQEIEQADSRAGDTKTIYKAVKKLSGTTRKTDGTTPSTSYVKKTEPTTESEAETTKQKKSKPQKIENPEELLIIGKNF